MSLVMSQILLWHKWCHKAKIDFTSDVSHSIVRSQVMSNILFWFQRWNHNATYVISDVKNSILTSHILWFQIWCYTFCFDVSSDATRPRLMPQVCHTFYCDVTSEVTKPFVISQETSTILWWCHMCDVTDSIVISKVMSQSHLYVISDVTNYILMSHIL